MAEAPQPPSPKSVVDMYKPWFDYASCLLGIAAWFVAIFYVAHQNLRPTPSNDWAFKAFTWGGVLAASAYGIFLITRFYAMTLGLISALGPSVDKKGIIYKLATALIVFWFFWGIPSFFTALTAELIEQVTEKARR